MKTTFSLKSHTALITGSSKGIGLAIARAFESAEADVLYHGRQPDSAPEGISTEQFIAADLMSTEGPISLIEEAFKRRPALDTLVANAGSFFDRPLLEMELADWRKTMQLNVDAVFLACQAFAKHLIKSERKGSIIIISSTNAFQSEDNSVAYDTSKGALKMLTRSMAHSLAPYGIRVNGVAPGLIQTPLTAPGFERNPEKRAHYERKILLKRIGAPEECAGPCAFLASDAAAYVTGHILVVDGGLTVGQIGDMPG